MNKLREYREKVLKMDTQAELADVLGVTQDKISRYEQGDSDDIPLSFFKNMAEKLGTSLEDILSGLNLNEVALPKAEKLSINYDSAWLKVNQAKNRLCKFIDNNMNDSFNAYPKAEELKNQCKNIVVNCTRKKRIAFVGHYSAGKSTMLNSLMGTDKLPSAWNPTTSAATFIRHIDDKPTYLAEGEMIAVFKSDKTESFNPALIYEDSFLAEEQLHILDKGDYSLLTKYGERKEDSSVNKEVAAIVIYLDCEILKNIDFVDLPGYGTEEASDDDFTAIMSSRMDALVYLSSSNQFLQGDEIAYLRNTIRTLPIFECNGTNNIKPLGNLFVVASQAHFIPAKEDLNKQIQSGISRFKKSLPMSLKEYFDSRSQTTGYDTENYFENRFFSYTTNQKDRREAFESDLKSFIENLPAVALTDTENQLKQFVDVNCKTINADLENYKRLKENLEKEEAEYKEIVLHEDERKAKISKAESEVLTAIDDYSSDSEKDFDNAFDETVNIEHIVQVIKDKGLKRCKDDIRLLADYLNAELEEKLNTTLSGYSNKLKFKIEKYLTDFENTSIKTSINSSMFTAFDVKRAFASGLAGLATLGGLSFWASTFGPLGGYILVAKGVSLLSMLGISISGGTAAAISAVAAIGGPIVLGIAVAIVAAFTVFSIFSGGWQKELARGIIKAYGEKKYGSDKNQDLQDLYHEVIKKFWKETKKAFEKASKATENEWLKTLDEMKIVIEKSKSDPAFDEQRKNSAEQVRNFLLQIPSIVYKDSVA